ncbi:thiamine phosphate synthase [Fluviicola chungangensis]|uniref:Thiamine phosphate synthase n=1 Tax=Fluviicola chungangensis TaxID=2597671 RepID=A0A556MRC3_9FLAO|nr:thiamine phosphate synthase [Fluviicola chungangensis]TSJ42402.1 thiamine phosphate synthase [Fluviicola chungangensis]
MLIVLSDSDFKPGEAQLVNQLFGAGLDLFHIRKYGASEESLLELIGQIDPEFHSGLVLHHDHEWGKSIGLKRFHYSERDRLNWKQQNWFGVREEFMYSTSVHSMEEYNGLPGHFSYAFLSPVFDSISKIDYKAVTFDLEKRRNPATKLIGLGGIQQENISEVFRMGFDGVALLGAIWHSENPLESFVGAQLIAYPSIENK